jgi:hypothetical protein
MTNCPRDKQIHLLSKVIIVQKRHTVSKFSRQCSCELKLDVVEWPDLMGRTTKSSA